MKTALTASSSLLIDLLGILVLRAGFKHYRHSRQLNLRKHSEAVILVKFIRSSTPKG
jgi:hypothetical protein